MPKPDLVKAGSPRNKAEMLIQITACRCLYRIDPAPCADGTKTAPEVKRPGQLEYG